MRSRLILFTALLLWCSWNSRAQEAYHVDLRFSKPPDVNFNSFKVDYPGAAAIYLLNDGHTDVFYDGALDIWKASTTYFYRIKILQSEGLDLANFEIPLRIKGKLANKEERIRDLKATTYNYHEMGYMEFDELSETDVIRNKVKKGVDVVSFALPNAKVNSIIEVSYVIDSPFLADLADWYFQKDQPVIRSKYSVSIWHKFQYAFVLSGLLKPVEKPRTNYLYTEKTWVIAGIHGFQEEPFMTSRQDHIAKLALQLNAMTFEKKEDSFLKSWSDVAGDLGNNKRFESFFTKKKYEDESLIVKDSLAYAMNLYTNFKSEFVWDGKFGVQPNVGLKEISKKGIGNASAMGLKLYQLLNSRGLNVVPVMCSLRSNGKVLRSYPLTERLIVTLLRLEIDNKVYLLDPLHDIPFGFLDKEFLNGEGLILGDTVAWQDLTIDAYEEKTGEVHVELKNDVLNANLVYSLGGYAALASTDDLESINSEWELSNVQIDEKDLKLKKVSASVNQEIDEDLVFFPFAFDNFIFNENPFKAPERTFPIDFYFKKKYNYKLIIDLSESYDFEVLPEDQNVQTSDNSLFTKIKVKRDGQRAEIIFEFQTDKTTFAVEDYSAITSAYEMMEKLKEMEIVVKRRL